MGKKHMRRQSGVLLLEVLVAMLIFSAGILAAINLLAVSTRQASDAQYRSSAAMLADDLVAGMWTSSRTPETLDAAFGSSQAGSAYTQWVGLVTSALPGVSPESGTMPAVTFTTVSAGSADATPSTRAQVMIFWRAPGDPRVHSHVTVAQIK